MYFIEGAIVIAKNLIEGAPMWTKGPQIVVVCQMPVGFHSDRESGGDVRDNR